MWMLIFMLSAQSAEPDEVADRLNALKEQFVYMQRIETVSDVSAERASRISAIEARLEAGVSSGDEINEVYREMDVVREWMWAHAVARPERRAGEFVETPEQWVVSSDPMTFTVSRSDLSMKLETPGVTWEFAACDDNDVLYDGGYFSLKSAEAREATAFHTGYSAGMRMTLSGFPKAPGLVLYLTVYLKEGEVVFDLASDEAEAKLGAIYWPKRLLLPASENAMTVCATMQGALIPGNWHQKIQYEGMTNSREFTMPWWGHIVDGHGVLVILDTPDDAGGSCYHQEGGPTFLVPKWYPSLGRLGYLRSIRYILEDNATYVSLAKRYRQYAKEKNRFVSLEEKCARTPALRSIIGSPIIHIGALYHYVPAASMYNKDREELNHQILPFDRLAKSLRMMKESGIDRAYVHLDGWGFYGYDSGHPDVLPPGYEQGGWEGLRKFAETCQELDYLFAVHDQYRDFYLNAASFDDRLAALDTEGKRFEVSQWCGGPQTVLSPRYAVEYVRRNHDLFKEHQIVVEGAYLDVFSILPFDESTQPGCPVTRTECAQYRQECFDLLRARGYVVSSEEPSDRYVGCLDLVHHGPYPMYPLIWSGDGVFGIPVPLFNLVYHDSLIIPWDMRSEGGWGIPAGTSGQLHCLLNAGPPYASVPYSAEESEAYATDKVKEAAELAKSCAFAEMLDHEFLNAEKTRQRATYSNGVQVTVDFATEEYSIGKTE